jgi:DNA invertase Pin-like site-specific DNA recombinase
MPHKPHKRAALYLAGTEDADMRRAILTDEARLRHWQVAATYHDTRGSRPELKRLQAAIMAGEVEALMVWDRTELSDGVLEACALAAHLNEQGATTARGATRTAAAVHRVLRRLPARHK